MAQQDLREVVIVDRSGMEHVFPPGFDRLRAIEIVKRKATPTPAPAPATPTGPARGRGAGPGPAAQTPPLSSRRDFGSGVGALFSPVGPVRRTANRLGNLIEGADLPDETDVPLAEMLRGIGEEISASPVSGTAKALIGLTGLPGLIQGITGAARPFVEQPVASARGFAAGTVRGLGAWSPVEMALAAAGARGAARRSVVVRRPGGARVRREAGAPTGAGWRGSPDTPAYRTGIPNTAPPAMQKLAEALEWDAAKTGASSASAELRGVRDLPDSAEPQSGVRRPLPRRSPVESALDRYRKRGAPESAPPRDVATSDIGDLIGDLDRVEPIIRSSIEGRPTDLAPRLVKQGGEQVGARPSAASERYVRRAVEEPLNVQAAMRRRKLERQQGHLVPATGGVDVRQIIAEALDESRAGDRPTQVSLPPSEPAPMPRTGGRESAHPGRTIPEPGGVLGLGEDSAAVARRFQSRRTAQKAAEVKALDRLAEQQRQKIVERAMRGRTPKIPLPFKEGESTLANLPKNASPEEVRAFIQNATDEVQAAPGLAKLPPLKPAGTPPVSSAVEAFNLKGKLFRRVKNLTTGDSKLDKDLTRFKWLAEQERPTADQLIEMGKTERGILANPALPKGVKSQWERMNERAARPVAGTTTRVVETAPAERATSGEIPSATAAARTYSGPERRGPGPQGRIDPHGGDPNVSYTAESLALEDAKVVAGVISGRKPATILIPSSDLEFGAGTPALLKKAREAGKVVYEEPNGVTVVARDQKSLDALLKAFKRAEAGDDTAHADIGRAFGYRQADIDVFYRNQGREAPPPTAAASRMVRVIYDENGIAIPVSKQPVMEMPIEAPTATAAGSAISALDDAVAAAKARIAARGTFKGVKLSSGLPLDDLADMAIIGGAKIAKGTVQFAQWSAEMVREFGEAVRPHLQAIFDKAKPHAAAYALPPLPKIKKVVVNGKETWQKIGVSERSEAAAERIRPKASIPPPEPPPPEIAAPARAEVMAQDTRATLASLLEDVRIILPKLKGVEFKDLEMGATNLLAGEVGAPLTPAGRVFVEALEKFASSPLPKVTTQVGSTVRPPISTRIATYRRAPTAGTGTGAYDRAVRVVPRGWGWPESVHRQTEARRPLENRKAAARLSAFIRRNVEVDAAKPKPDVDVAVRSPEDLGSVRAAPTDLRRSQAGTAFNAPKLTILEQKAREKLAQQKAAQPIAASKTAPVAVPVSKAAPSAATPAAARPAAPAVAPSPAKPQPLIEAFIKQEVADAEGPAPSGVEPDTWSFIRAAEREAVDLIANHGVRDPRLIDPLRRFWGSKKTAEMLGISRGEVEAISGSPHRQRPMKQLLEESDARYRYLINDPRGFLRTEAVLAGTGAAAGGLVGATIEGEGIEDRVAYAISGALLGGALGHIGGKGLEAAVAAVNRSRGSSGGGRKGPTILDHAEVLDTAQMLAGPAAIKASLGSLNAIGTVAFQRLQEGRWADAQRGLRFLRREGTGLYLKTLTAPTADLARMNKSVLNVAQKVNAESWSGKILTNVLRPFMAMDRVAEETISHMGVSKSEIDNLLLMGEPTSWRGQAFMKGIGDSWLLRMMFKFSRIRVVSLERAMEMTPFMPERFSPRSAPADVPAWFKGFKQAEPLRGKALRARRQIGGATLVAGTAYGYYDDPSLAKMSVIAAVGGSASLLASAGMAAGKGIRRGRAGLLEALGEIAASVPSVSESTIRTAPDRIRLLGPLRRAIAGITGEDPWDTIRGR